MTINSAKTQRLWQRSAVIFSIFTWAIASPNALANCNDQPADPSWYQPAISKHLQTLDSSSEPAVERADIYDRIEGDRILLTPAFNTLSGLQKTEAITAVTQINLQDYFTPEEFEQKLVPPGSEGIGTFPFDFIASDDRTVSAVYDGCTLFQLLTEKDRFDYYYTFYFNEFAQTAGNAQRIRNVGTPSWRTVNFPIDEATEQAIRLGFWNLVGYENTDWWIAWVPETGKFEVNVPENFEYDRLQRYWQVADRGYSYVVVREGGTVLGEKQF